jgi:hypothetical protein
MSLTTIRVWKQVHAACLEKSEFRLVSLIIPGDDILSGTKCYRLKFAVSTSSSMQKNSPGLFKVTSVAVTSRRSFLSLRLV